MHQHSTIPQEFYSFETGTPFTNCIECDKYLLDDDQEYFVEKAYKRYEGFTAEDIIFEYAICLSCAERMRKAMSKDSLASLEQYFMQHIDFEKRMNLMHTSLHDPKAWTNSCMITGESKSELKEYQVFAQCRGNQLVLGQMPYLVSGKILDEVSSLLSNETLHELDDFSRRHFGPPPELAKDLPHTRVVMI